MNKILLINDYKLTVAQANADIYGNKKEEKEAVIEQKKVYIESKKDELNLSEEDRDNNMLIIMTMLNIE